MGIQKNKISQAKRNNQKRNKLVKQGVIKKLKKSNKPNFKQAPNVPSKLKQQENETDESDIGEDMLDMVEEEDLNFLKQAIANKSYQLLNKVQYTGPSKKSRNHEDDSLENNYEDQIDVNEKKMKILLPIKTKRGLIHQEIEEEEETLMEEQIKDEENIDVDEGIEESDNEEEISLKGDSKMVTKEPLTEAKLLATRNETLRQRKIHIGTLSSGILESPEEKLTNFRTLLSMMDEECPEAYFTVKKLVIVSLLEVFKDVLPSYEIKPLIQEGVKLKKDTLKLHKFEENLLIYYKKYLQKLEKCAMLLVKKKGDSRRRTAEEMKLGELAVHAMCELLSTHPYFNYSQNIAQAIVPFLNNSNSNVRRTVKESINEIIKQDKKEEITLKILRLINHYLKSHAHNVNVEMLQVLLALNLHNVNLDQEKEHDLKEKKLNSHKQRLLQMSKREKKRNKKLRELEQEMLETKAEESKITKQKNLTEITKIVFNIYFRILKTSSNTKVLGACLEGLAKFAHCINLEYYIDIVNVLDKLLKEDWISYREQLFCIQTVFAILGGQGEALNLDPTRFYNSLYQILMQVSAARNYEHFEAVLKTLIDALIKRRKKITNKRTIGFIKKICTLSLQLLHNGTLGCLGLVKTILQLNRSVGILLDLDSTFGEGKYDAELADPEYSNAGSTALYEMVPLAKHYHPVVRKYAQNIARDVPPSGEGSLPLEYSKKTIEELYNEFNMLEMGFNPPVPPPSKNKGKFKPKSHFSDLSFEEECRGKLKAQIHESFWINL